MAQETCCTAGFSGSASRVCSKLFLNLTPDCDPTGAQGSQHLWSITTPVAGQCLTLVGFVNTHHTVQVQLTNINTSTTTSLVVTHTFTCPTDGSVTTLTKTISLANATQGVYIGRGGTPTATSLADYYCALGSQSSFNGGNKPLFVTGIVNIPSTFTFTNTDIRMDGGNSGFTVLANSTLTLEQGTRVRGNIEVECDCMWRGIYVNGKGRLITKGNTGIEDAVFAIRPYQKSEIEIQRTNFRRNFIGVRGTDGGFTHKFVDNEFDGTGPLRRICELAYLINDVQPHSIGGLPSTLMYSATNGFAGIFVRGIGVLSIPKLAYERQNRFHGLAVGIEAFDTNVSISRSCRFNNIHSGSYNSFGGMAVSLIDTELGGSNNLSFIGARNTPPPPVLFPEPDFNLCDCGVFVYSEVPADGLLGTKIDIGQCRMTDMSIGVHLDSYNGSISGKQALGNFFTGVHDNYIQAMFNWNLGTGGVGSPRGIYYVDYSPTQSNLEIKNNVIDVDGYGADGSYGIWLKGGTGLTDLNQFQVDIHHNRINLNAGIHGIWVDIFNEVHIHDNRGTGNGIFVNTNLSINGSTGIHMFLSKNNLVSCNDIVSTAQAAIDANTGLASPNMIFVNAQKSPQVFGNHTTGAGTGMKFSGANTNSTIKCNTMENNTHGLSYTIGTMTGNQGDPSTSFGNLWINSDAFATQGFIPDNNRFFVRNIPNENPSSNVNDWFRSIVPNQPTCPTCPSSTTSPSAAVLTVFDRKVARDEVEYSFYPVASRWWERYNLYEKLVQHPQFVGADNDYKAFLLSVGNTPMAKLVGIVGAIDSLFLINNTQRAILEDNTNAVNVLLEQIRVLDSLIYEDEPPGGLAEQRDSLLVLLANIEAGNQVVIAQLNHQRLSGLPGVASRLYAVEPSNDYESSYKSVLKVLVESSLAGSVPSLDHLNDLLEIGGLCVYEGGPAVYIARSLYTGFTNIHLPEIDCPGESGRPASINHGPSEAKRSLLRIFPNPASERLRVQVSSEDAFKGGATVELTLVNSLGKVVFRQILLQPTVEVNVANLPAGLYTLVVESKDKAFRAAQPVFVNHP